MRGRWGWAIGVGVAALVGCGKTTTPQAVDDGGPVRVGDWTYYGTPQGLPADVQDVSADEDGNVYVAGGDALYARTREASDFLRFDSANAGLSKKCNDPAEMMNETPPGPFTQCAVISVAGAAPGMAIVGYDGFGMEADNAAAWARRTGGADVVTFDPGAGTLSRTRHVFIASPPHVVCGVSGETFGTCSDPNDYWWVNGRRLFRKVIRIVVNHDPSSAMYGDAWMGGGHATFAALLARTAERGWVDPTAGFGPDWEEAKDVWEHLHPAIVDSLGIDRLGTGFALSLDPRDGTPWGSNGIRTTSVGGYGPDISDKRWWMGSIYDLWTDSGDNWYGPTNDEIRSVSHCADGTLWVGSLTHGLARIAPGGAVSFVALPDPAIHHDSVSALSCDPSDGSLWVGLGDGGILRLKSGAFTAADPPGAPEVARQPVRSIQIDRWATPRTVYFAFGATTDASGAVLAKGGVAAYDGP